MITMNYIEHTNFRSINGRNLSPSIFEPRADSLVKYYNKNVTYYHPIKLSQVIKNLNERYK